MKSKTILSIAMAASLAAGIAVYPAVSSVLARTGITADAGDSSTTTDGWHFFYDDTHCEITGCTDDVQGNVTFPSVIEVEGKELPVTKVQNNFYYSGKYITDLTIPGSIKVLPSQFCELKENLKTVTFEGSLIVLPNAAFEKCRSLKTITLPSDLVEIGSSAFSVCIKLESIQIPDTVTTFGNYVFSGCEALKKVTIPGSIAILSDYTFKDCTSLESVTLEDGVKSIGGGAFSGCTSLTEVTFPKSVTDLSDSLIFSGCTNLESITIENPECKINNIYGSEEKPLIIYGYEGSTAEKYCKDGHHCEFKSLGEKPVKPAVPDTGEFCDADGDGQITSADAQFVLVYSVEDMLGNNPSWYALTKNPKAPDAN